MTQKVSKSSINLSHFKFRRLVLALVFLFAAHGVWGENYYWVGGEDIDWTKLENWATTFGGTGGDGITDYPQSGAGDTIFFSNTDPDTSVKYTLNSPADFEFGNLYVWGNVDIVINGTCTATSFNMQADAEDHFVTNDFEVTLSKGTGNGELTVSGGTGINLTRASGTTGVVGTFTIDTTLQTNSIETHSGVTLQINQGKSLTTATYIHNAGNADVIAKTIINGTFEATTSFDMAYSVYENAGSTEVSIGDHGVLTSPLIKPTTTVYRNPSSTVPFTNNGTINTKTFDIPYNVVNKGTINTNASPAEIKALSFSGANGIINLNSVATSLTVTNSSEQKTINLENTTSEIKGTFALTNFTANTNMNGKTITLDNATITADSISVSGTTGDGNRLSLTGTGTFEPTALTASYLSIGDNVQLGNYKISADSPLTGCVPLAGDSSTNYLAILQNGWLIQSLSDYAFEWTGSNGSDGTGAWNDEKNWNTGYVPVADCEITIPNTANKPVITSAVTVKSITINGSSALTVNTPGSLIITDATTFNEKISGTGKYIVASDKTFSVSTPTTLDINIENNGIINVLSSLSATSFSDSGSGTRTINLNGATTSLTTTYESTTTNAIVLTDTDATIKGNFEFSSFTATDASMSGKTITLDDSVTTIIKAGTILLEGTGTGSSLLTLAGTGTINPTTTLTPQYLSIGPNITLQDYPTDISGNNCEPSVNISKAWINLIKKGWNIATITAFEYKCQLNNPEVLYSGQ